MAAARSDICLAEHVEPVQDRAELSDELLRLGQRLAGGLDQVGEIEGHFALHDVAVGQRLAVWSGPGVSRTYLAAMPKPSCLIVACDVLAELERVVDFDDDLDAVEQSWSADPASGPGAG